MIDRNGYAEAGLRRHQDFASRLQSIYANALMSGYGFPVEAFDAVSRYIEIEVDAIQDDLRAVFSDALRATEMKFAVTLRDETRSKLESHLSAAQHHLYLELSTLAQRDALTFKQTLLRARMEIANLSNIADIDNRRAAILHRLGSKTRLELKNRDALGRSIAADTMVRNAWRQAVVFLENEITLIVAADSGISRLGLMKLEEGRPVQKAVVALTGQGGLTYDEAVKAYFHPNSSAWLDLEVLDVHA